MSPARKKTNPRRTRSNPRPARALHPFLRLRHPNLWMCIYSERFRFLLLPVAVLVLGLGSALVAPAGAAAGPQQKRPRPCQQFLIFGTVFQESGLLLPGAELQVRRAGEKKVRWRQVSDRRGEFGICVPTGAEYELTVKAEGFEVQTMKIDARVGNREDLTIRMKPAEKGKKK